MSVDADHNRLFAAAPTNNTLEIADLSSGKPWRSLKGEKPAAARYAPEFNQLFVSRGQSVYIYDGKTFDLITRIDLQSKAGTTGGRCTPELASARASSHAGRIRNRGRTWKLTLLVSVPRVYQLGLA